MNPWEAKCTGIYWLFQLLLLPSLLNWVNSFLPVPFPAAELNFVYFTVNFGVVLLILWDYIKHSWADIKRDPARIPLFAIVGFLAYQLLGIITTNLILAIDPDFSNINDASINEMTQASRFLMVISTVFMVPFVEELFYRGFLFAQLRNRSRLLAYGVSIAVFCFIHIMGYIGSYSIPTLLLCFLQYIPAGLCIAWAYEISDSIFTPMLIHMLVNGLGMALMR